MSQFGPKKTKVGVFAGSRRVLTAAMDDGQGLLFASAPSISLHTWVQQGFPVTLVTDVRIQAKLRRTVDLTVLSNLRD